MKNEVITASENKLMESIEAKHNEIMKHGQSIVELAIAAGHDLIKLKAKVKKEQPHIGWTNWAGKASNEGNLKIGADTYTKYMKLANNENIFSGAPEKFPSINQALTHITKVKKAEKLGVTVDELPEVLKAEKTNRKTTEPVTMQHESVYDAIDDAIENGDIGPMFEYMLEKAGQHHGFRTALANFIKEVNEADAAYKKQIEDRKKLVGKTLGIKVA